MVSSITENFENDVAILRKFGETLMKILTVLLANLIFRLAGIRAVSRVDD